MFKRCWKLCYSMRVSLHSPLKAILPGRSGCQKNEKSMLGGEKLSDRRKAKTLELNRAAWSAPTESRRVTERSLSEADTAEICSLSPPTFAWFTVLLLSKAVKNTLHRCWTSEWHPLEKQKVDDNISQNQMPTSNLIIAFETKREIKTLKMRPHKHVQNHREGRRSQEAASDS